MNTIKLSAAVSIDKGRVRGNNEDNFYFDGRYLTAENRNNSGSFEAHSTKGICLYGVFDGMGGEARGEDASLITAETLRKNHAGMENSSDLDVDKAMAEAINDANMQICQRIVDCGEGRIGTTFSAVCIKDNIARVYNVGDSRVYLLRKGKLSQISVDDTTAQRLVNLGVITQKEAKTHKDKHKLTQHLGIFPDEMIIEPHISKSIVLTKGDRLLLCSDGLTDMVDDKVIEELLNKSKSSKEAADKLVAEALKNGGRDNVTAMVISAEREGDSEKKNYAKLIIPILIAVILCICGAVAAVNFLNSKPKEEPPAEKSVTEEKIDKRTEAEATESDSEAEAETTEVNQVN